MREKILKNSPVKESKVSEIKIPTLFLGIGTPKRRASVGAMSAWIDKKMQTMKRHNISMAFNKFSTGHQSWLENNKQQTNFKKKIVKSQLG